MCYIVLRQLLIVVCIFTVKGVSFAKIVNLSLVPCWECKLPQPRSVVLAKEINITTDTAPYMVILHRCDEGSGCCREIGSVCKVAKVETFNATIFVKDLTTNKYKSQYFEISNHTECSCQNPNDTPK